MKGPVRAVILAVAVVILVGGAFWGGIAYQSAKAGSATGRGAFTASGGAQGGPMANLTDAERTQLQNMTDAERQAWLQKKFGTQAGQGGPTRGGTIEGDVIEVASDSITVKLSSGTQTIYTDENTVFAYVKGASDLAAGSKVMIIAPPSGLGANSSSSTAITTATLVVVK